MPGLWRGDHPILLASASGTRLALLVSAGLPVDREVSGLDEDEIKAQADATDPAALAARLADAKALAVSRRRPDRVVLGADQVLAVSGEIVSKPPDAAGARRQIGRLSGRPHHLHSAFAIAQAGRVEARGSAIARLTMRALTAEEIGRYVALAGPAATRSVGGYEIEALGIHLFEAVAGDHSTILGLPLLPVLAALRSLKLVTL